MFVWDFNVIIAVGVTLSLGLVLAVWVLYTISNSPKDTTSSQEFFRQCDFCSFVFFDYLKKLPCRCPRCGSWQG